MHQNLDFLCAIFQLQSFRIKIVFLSNIIVLCTEMSEIFEKKKKHEKEKKLIEKHTKKPLESV